MRRTRFGLGSKNSARLKSFYILLFFFLFFFFPLPIYPNIPSSSLWKSGKNTVEKWNKNGERENSLATCQAKKEKEKKRERTRLCSYYFLMAHSSLLLPRSSLQSKLLDISSPPFVVHFVAPLSSSLVGRRWLSRSHTRGWKISIDSRGVRVWFTSG